MINFLNQVRARVRSMRIFFQIHNRFFQKKRTIFAIKNDSWLDWRQMDDRPMLCVFV